MQALVEAQIKIDEWRGLYGESWKGVIVDEAFAHPAKFSRALIRRIYDHVIAEGWATKGDSVIDPFGGVALGGLDAMRHGLSWIGCELEEKFVNLGGKNIDLWNERYSRMPSWGTARVVQGDSRKLAQVLSAAECCVSSLPYCEGLGHGGQPTRGAERSEDRNLDAMQNGYGSSEGQIGAMKEGDHSLVVSSPPYAGSLANAKNYADPEKAKADSEREFMKHRSATYSDLRYGDREGNLGAMPEGHLCVTSPPYNPPMSQDHNGTRGGQRGTTPSEKGAFAKYGNSEGQLEGMPMDGFDAAISSPPYERDTISRDQRPIGPTFCERTYGTTDGQLGSVSGETFWSASRLVLEQLHQAIVPGGHAVFVVKAFVRDKKIVDFPAQWAQLCEAVGFRLLHDHHALLTEHYGTQCGFDEDKRLTVERKSFFRRLAESKGSPRIDHENVLCFERR